MANPTARARVTAREAAAQGHQRPGGYVAARAVGSYVPTLTRKAFEKFGFSAATLVTDWAQIVGADIAGSTVPVKLSWPRRAESDLGDEAGQGSRPQKRIEATLVLRVDPAVALDIQYRTRQILERINGYFGYRAVAQVKIEQGTVAEVGEARQIVSGAPAGIVTPAPADVIPGNGDEMLRKALTRMRDGITRRQAAA